MAKPVVDLLQPVQIRQDDDEPLAAAARQLQPLRERKETAPVVQARELVGERQIDQLALQLVSVDCAYRIDRASIRGSISSLMR